MVFSNPCTAFQRKYLSYNRTSKPQVMNSGNNKWSLLLLVVAGTLIGIFRGSEARQKWFFKIKNRQEEKKQLAEQKKYLRSGGVALDDIEMAAFHK